MSIGKAKRNEEKSKVQLTNKCLCYGISRYGSGFSLDCHRHTTTCPDKWLSVDLWCRQWSLLEAMMVILVVAAAVAPDERFSASVQLVTTVMVWMVLLRIVTLRKYDCRKNSVPQTLSDAVESKTSSETRWRHLFSMTWKRSRKKTKRKSFTLPNVLSSSSSSKNSLPDWFSPMGCLTMACWLIPPTDNDDDGPNTYAAPVSV